MRMKILNMQNSKIYVVFSVTLLIRKKQNFRDIDLSAVNRLDFHKSI